MSFELPLPATGRPKRDLVEMAHEICGQAGFDFELTADEVKSTMRLLDVMMSEAPFNLMGYNTTFPSLPEDASGLGDIDVSVVVSQLALRRAPGMGKSMAPEALAAMARAWNSACARYATVPTALLAPNTPRGSGSGRFWYSPFINEQV